MIDYMVNLAFFACGFGFAVVLFFSEIRIGVQLKREARRKMREGVIS